MAQEVDARPAGVTARRDGPAPAGRTVVAVLAVGAFAVGTNVFVVPGVLVGLAADLDVPVATAGTLVTAFALAYAVGAVCSGSVTVGRPLRPVLVASVALAGLSAVTAAAAPTFPVLMAARVLGALAAACFLPAAGAAAAAAVPEEHRGRALAAMLAAGSAAMLAGAPSTALLGAWLGWRAAFVLVAALAAVAVAGLLRWGAGITGSARTARWPVVRAPVVGLLAVTTAVLTGSNALLTYLGAVLPTGHPVALAPVLALFGLGGVVGSWWGGCATDRRGGPVVARRTTAALLATFAVFPLLAPTVVGLVAVAVAWGAGVWALVPAQQHRLIHLEPAAAPVLLALHGAASHLGFAAGALLGGLVVDAAGADHLWLVAAGGCAAGLILHALLTKETS